MAGEYRLEEDCQNPGLTFVPAATVRLLVPHTD